MHVAGAPLNTDGFLLAVTAPQQCQLAWLPSDLSAVVAGKPAFALLETRDAAGNRLLHVRSHNSSIWLPVIIASSLSSTQSNPCFDTWR